MSHPASSGPRTIAPVVLTTVLGHLVPHFLASTNGDPLAAREAAGSMLAAYGPATEQELHLAAEIVSFSLHALKALGQAAEPDLSLNRVLRLRGSAVSLSREAHKAQRKLDQCQRARISGSPQPATPSRHAPAPRIEATIMPVRPDGNPSQTRASEPPSPNPKPFVGQVSSKFHQQRRAAERITENLRRNKAEQEHRAAAMTASGILAESVNTHAVTSSPSESQPHRHQASDPAAGYTSQMGQSPLILS